MSETAVSAQKEVIVLQKRVIDIQEQHIERTETVVGEKVRDTLQTEIRSYSGALASDTVEAVMKKVPQQQAAAPTFEAMRKVVKFAAEEEERAKRLVFFGLDEGEKEGDEVDPYVVIKALDLAPNYDSIKRLGVRKQLGTIALFWSQWCKTATMQKINKTIIKQKTISHELANINIPLFLQWFCNHAL